MRRTLVVFAALIGLVAVLITPASAPVYLAHATSGSMTPTIDAGDGYVVVGAGDVEVGDVVVFRSAERGGFVTHRVVDRTDGGFVTKGDANDETDQATGLPPVPRAAIEGKVLAVAGTPVVIPGLGGFVDAVSANGALALGIVVAVGVLVGIGDRRRRDPHDRSVLRVRHVVPPLLVGAAVLSVAVVVLASSSHVVVLEGDGAGGGTATVTLRTDPGPLTHVVVDARGATVEERTVEGDSMRVTLSVPEDGTDGTSRLGVHPYPRTLPTRGIETLHAIHPALAAIGTVLAVLGPLSIAYVTVLDGQQPLRRPIRRGGGDR